MCWLLPTHTPIQVPTSGVIPFHNHNAGCLGKKPVIVAHTPSESSIAEVGHRERLLEIVPRIRASG